MLRRSSSLLRLSRGRPFRQCNRFLSAELGEREAMEYDVVIVGAGPSGLATSIRLKQLAAEKGTDIDVCIVEKGAEVGSHILSGNIFDPVALNALIPDWKEKGAPLNTPVTDDKFYFLTEKRAFRSPVVPPTLHNDGNYVISLGQLCRWLGEQAEELGVEIFPGFAASEALFDGEGKVKGIATGDMGLQKDGTPGPNFERGMELHAKQLVVAEGSRGSLAESLISKFDLRHDCDPQLYGLGVKEIWEIDGSKHKPGFVMHSMGWPLPSDTYGGSFLYHMGTNHVLVGFVTGLDYKNPYMSPYENLQTFKHHPIVKEHLDGGKCVSYGARVINEGGYQSLPKLTFPGGVLVGCSAGFLNLPKLKGSHYAMQSGMIAAEAIFDPVMSQKEEGCETPREVVEFEENMHNSWVVDELRAVRNIHGGFKHGIAGGVMNSGLSLFLTKGKEPWTFTHPVRDCQQTRPISECEPINYIKPDGKLSFDILTSVQRTNTYHEDDEPSHLKIKPEWKHIPEDVSYQKYGAPETRFCPAKVYEYNTDDPTQPKLVINSQNCIHCKCCSIKTPEEFIEWTVPQGGGGPKYEIM